MKNRLPIDPLQLLGIVFLLGIFVFLVFFIDMEYLREQVTNLGAWAPVGFVFLKMLTIVVAPLSGALLYPLVGLLFGFWEGLLYVAIGDFLGYSIAFFISRLFGQRVVLQLIARKESGLLARIVARMSTFKGYLVSCLILFFSPELISYSAGLSRLPYWKFIVVLWPGSVIATSVLVAFGSNFGLSSQNSMVITITSIVIGSALLAAAVWFFLRERKASTTNVV